MTNQTVVPDGMVLINGKLEKKAELKLQHKLENLLVHNFTTWFYFWKSIAWWWKLAYLQYKKGHRKSISTPVVLSLFGDNPEACIDVLKSYGVYACEGSICWAVVWNQVNLRLLLLVAKSQYEFADNILAQTSCDDYQITDTPGPKRGQALPRPYAQRHAQPARKPAKLGQRYK